MQTYKLMMQTRAAEHIAAKEKLKSIGRPLDVANPSDAEELIAVQRVIRTKIDFEMAFNAWANRHYSETDEVA
jgi:hypothetical protein